MKDLVAVRVADPGHEGLVAEQALQLARVAPDPLPPGVQGERRVVGVGAQARPMPRHDAGRSGRDQVDLAHPGRVKVAELGGRLVGREPGGAARPGRRRPGGRGSRPEHEPGRRPRFRRARRSELESAGQHRGDPGDLPASMLQDEVLPAAVDRAQDRAAKSVELGGRCPDDDRVERLGRQDRPAAEGRRRTPPRGRRDRAARASPDCSPPNPCARLTRPPRARTAEEPPDRRHRKERTARQRARTDATSHDDGSSEARAVVRVGEHPDQE